MTRFFALPTNTLAIIALLCCAFVSPSNGQQREQPKSRNERLREKAAPPKPPGKLEKFVLALQGEVEQAWPKSQRWPR